MTVDTLLSQASAAVGVIGGSAGLFALWRTERQRMNRRRDAPQELWDLILGINYDFGDIVAFGGREGPWFLEESRQRDRAKLGAVAVQLVDDELSGLVAGIQSAYHETFVWAGGPGQRDVARTQKQIDAARRGQSQVALAIARMGKLRRDAS